MAKAGHLVNMRSTMTIVPHGYASRDYEKIIAGWRRRDTPAQQLSLVLIWTSEHDDAVANISDMYLHHLPQDGEPVLCGVRVGDHIEWGRTTGMIVLSGPLGMCVQMYPLLRTHDEATRRIAWLNTLRDRWDPTLPRI